MKKTILILIAILSTYISIAQHKYEFTEIIKIESPRVENQGNSGTCWCFSTLSFLESEMAANGCKDIPNLSEMFVVRYSYIDKAKKYVYMHGNTNFSEGGFFYDNLYVLKNYGIVPESIYPNSKNNEEIDHKNFSKILKQYVDKIANDNIKTIDPNWIEEYTKITDDYLGANVEQFTYKGKTYTPQTFATEVVKLNADDYIQVTSFTHHPFYQNCILELPDNWRWSQFFNVPINDLIEIIDCSLKAGHTVVWSSDVSEAGFNYDNGTATLPGINPKGMEQKDIDDFKNMTVDKQKLIARLLTSPGIEMNVTQESRQIDFESRQTTDDHGMQIIGIANDQLGNKFYIVKNSWGNYNKLGGYLYASEAYVKAKTTGIMINKNINCDILKKHGIN